MTDFAAWDRKAAALVQQAESEEAEEKALNDQALGIDGKAKGPPTELAEKQLAELSELSEQKKAILKTHGCLPGQEDPRELVLRGGKENATTVISQGEEDEVVAPPAEKAPGKAIRFVGWEDAKLRVPEVKEGEPQILKVFVENCKRCSLEIEARLKVGVFELYNCEAVGTGVRPQAQGSLETIQADNCKDCVLAFQGGPSDNVAAIYHANCPGLMVLPFSHSATTLVAPMQEDGVTHDPRQHVTRLVAPTTEEEAGNLETRLVIRGEKDFPMDLPTTSGKQPRHVASPVQTAAGSTTAGGYADAGTTGKGGSGPSSGPPPPALSADEEERARLQAEQKKQEGNVAFQNSDFMQAAALYTEALEACPRMHLALANRAQCFLKLGHPEKALQDSEKCIEVGPAEFAKGYFRKGMALHAMQRYGEAVQALVEAEKRDPKNKQIQEAIKMSGMMARKQAEKSQ